MLRRTVIESVRARKAALTERKSALVARQQQELSQIQAQIDACDRLIVGLPGNFERQIEELETAGFVVNLE